MNALLVANLPGFAANPTLFADEALVNSLWNGILQSAFPTTGAANSFLICPEMVKGTKAESYVADLAVMQISNAATPTFNKPALCFEGKSSDSGDSFEKLVNQVKDWTSKAKIGTYGCLWGIGAKGSGFVVVALDRRRDDMWRAVVLPAAGAAPTFTKAQPTLYSLTNAPDVALLSNFIAYITANPFPTIPSGS